MRVLVNTSSPQGSTGITTNVFPAMTLGCGAVAGNATSDNISPLNLINVKRLAYAVREAHEAFEAPIDGSSAATGSDGAVDRGTIVAAVDRYLAARGFPTASPTPGSAASGIAAQVVDRFLSRKSGGDKPGFT
jgi:hypothetical protein